MLVSACLFYVRGTLGIYGSTDAQLVRLACKDPRHHKLAHPLDAVHLGFPPSVAGGRHSSGFRCFALTAGMRQSLHCDAQKCYFAGCAHSCEVG